MLRRSKEPSVRAELQTSLTPHDLWSVSARGLVNELSWGLVQVSADLSRSLQISLDVEIDGQIDRVIDALGCRRAQG